MSASARRRSPGRPRSFNADKVLDAALEIFWHRGYRDTTTRALEAQLRLGQSSLYNTFGTKQALLAAALDRYQTRITKDLVGPLEKSREGLAAIDRFFQDLGRWIAGDGRRGCMLINLMAEDGGVTEPLARRTKGYRDRLRRAFHKVLTQAARDGQIDAHSTRDRAALLLGVVLGLNISARGGASRAEIRRLISGTTREVAGWRKN